MNTLIVFAKYPEPGKVKTRLGNIIGFELACEFYKIFLQLTFDMAKHSNIDSIKICFAPADKKTEFEEMTLGEFTLIPQRGDGLGVKLYNAFSESFKNGARKTVIMGSDSPTLSSTVIKEAINHLDHEDLVLGPAYDGGYYLIGAGQSYEFLFDNIEWSTASVLAQTLRKAERRNLKYSLLPKWYDIDDLQTLRRAGNDDSSGLIAELMKKYPRIFLPAK